MAEPLVSVIVPVYNVERYLERCVKSIQNQTYKNLEIILVDDGSPDNSGKMCDNFAKSDNRILVIHKENGGLSDARNAGLDIMTGEFVGFVDSDDWIAPKMYETLYNMCVSKNAQIACCGIAKYKNDKIESYFNPNLQEQFTLSKDDAHIELIKNYRITNSLCDKLFEAEIFSNLRMKKGILYEDLQIQPYCIENAQRITYTANPLYYYFMSETSILRGDFSLRQYDCINISQERIDFYKKNHPNCVPWAKAAHYELCLNTIYKSIGFSKWDIKRKELVKEVLAPIPKDIKNYIPKKIMIKRLLLKISPKFYHWVLRLYYSKTNTTV